MAPLSPIAHRRPPHMTTTAPRTRRVIINTDAKNEADDQFAIVHALLSETLDVRGLIAAHFGDSRSATSMLDSRAEIDLLLGHLNMPGIRRSEERRVGKEWRGG